jgi:hypothetical protein
MGQEVLPVSGPQAVTLPLRSLLTCNFSERDKTYACCRVSDETNMHMKFMQGAPLCSGVYFHRRRYWIAKHSCFKCFQHFLPHCLRNVSCRSHSTTPLSVSTVGTSSRATNRNAPLLFISPWECYHLCLLYTVTLLTSARRRHQCYPMNTRNSFLKNKAAGAQSWPLISI